MSNKKEMWYLVAGLAIMAIGVLWLILSSSTGKKEQSVSTAEEGQVLEGLEIGDEAEDTGETTLDKNPDARTEFLDLYMLGDVIPPECLMSVPGVIQEWLDKAFNNNTLMYTIKLDRSSIEQTEMYAAFNFTVEEFPEYSFRYAHYYGTNDVIIGSPELGHLKFGEGEE